MLNSSLRRVARTCSNAAPVPSRPTPPSVASFASHAHQRRHSSSKPPVPPNNGSPAIPATSVKQVGAPRSESKRPGAESRLSKRKTARDKVEAKQDLQDDWTSKLPSVPSLQHLNPKDIYVASFFSTHRPISITGPVPSESSIETIDKIFAPKPKRARPAPQEVIFTLSSAVQNLDEHISNKQGDGPNQTAEQKAAIIKALMQRHNGDPADPNQAHHLDGPPQSISTAGGNVHLVIQEFARRFRPFNVPPPPQPMSDAEINAAEAQAEAEAEASANEEMQARSLEVEIEQQEYDPYVQQVVINVPQDSDLQSRDFFTSNGSPIIEHADVGAYYQIEEPSSSGRSRPGLTYLERARRMYAISVKRQRRLKMKKHKYKKLMRKTRNLRRRLGQV